VWIFWEREEIVTPEENELLDAEITEDEIFHALKGSYEEGSPGPDGFSFLFYHKFWSIIKKDCMALVRAFDKGDLNIASLNYTMVILIPKEDNANTLKKFRPISLINCSFKVFANALNNRLEDISGRLLASNQTTFVKGRYILESVVGAHEIIYYTVKNVGKGIFLKLDYEKAYDSLSWQFLEEMLTSRGFGQRWISWVLSLVRGGSISIRVNDENNHYFKAGKCLRQGDPLSPLMFNLVVDVFTRMLTKAAAKGYITGFMDNLYAESIISLQYVDDALLFLKHRYLEACHLKWLMICFEKLPGMKNNYNKSDLIPLNLSEQGAQMYSRTFCCKLGNFPIKHLGVPVHHEKLKREGIQPVVDKTINMIPKW
jgi:hypothetical protein